MTDKQGLGVDHIDTRTLKTKVLEQPKGSAVEFLTDGRGNVRIAGFVGPHGSSGQVTGDYIFQYRLPNSTDWHRVSTYNSVERTGFESYLVDHDKNIAFGAKKGRPACHLFGETG